MLDLKAFKYELQNIIERNEYEGQKNLIKAAQAYLIANTRTSKNVENPEQTRAEEERALINCFCSQVLPMDN